MTKKISTDPFEQIFQDEIDHIKKTIGKSEVDKDQLVSLSLSGGGIRSAAFGLGVIHALVATDKLQKIDYLSTVSGGGFIGSALTWALHMNKGKGESILKKEQFPLGQVGEGSRTGSNNHALNYIRQQTNYLCPGKGLNFISTLGVLLRGMILGILAYCPLVALVLYVLRPWALSEVYLHVIGGLLVTFCVISVSFSVISNLLYRAYSKNYTKKSDDLTYKLRNATQNVLGKISIATLTLLVIWSLKPISDYIYGSLEAGLSIPLSTLAGYGAFIGQFLKNTTTKKTSATGNTVLFISAAVIVYSLLLVAYSIAQFYPTYLWIGVAVSLTIGLIANINMVGLHRLYRDRLMETFLPDENTVASQQWDIAKSADRSLLQTMCDIGTPGPYHLCCGTINLKNSEDRKVRGRLGDSFIMSPLYCGSSATNWQKTKTFMKGKLHLATAMAISGAAANPNAGASGGGVVVNPLISFIMTILNIRLGYWAPNPNHKRAKNGWTPNFFFPGFQDLFGIGYKKTSPYLELTDGVNFENLGLYEMIRRKVKIAIISDGSPDFSSLANAIEKVRVDFGVTILFTDPDYDLNGLLPDSGESNPFQSKYNTAKRGFAIGKIYYPDGTEGQLFYFKATVIDGLPIDIYSYKSINPDFPNESTADQFFSEMQFESYRELGYRLSSALLSKLDNNWNLTLLAPLAKEQVESNQN